MMLSKSSRVYKGLSQWILLRAKYEQIKISSREKKALIEITSSCRILKASTESLFVFRKWLWQRMIRSNTHLVYIRVSWCFVSSNCYRQARTIRQLKHRLYLTFSVSGFSINQSTFVIFQGACQYLTGTCGAFVNLRSEKKIVWVLNIPWHLVIGGKLIPGRQEAQRLL